MPKYHLEVTFVLRTDIEPDGYVEGLEYADGVSDYEEQSSFYMQPVGSEGGTVSFTVEAASEAEAEERARDLFEGNASFRSNDEIEWEIEDVDVTVLEEIVPEMNFEIAWNTVQALIRRNCQEFTAEEQAAVDFLLALAKERQAVLVAVNR